MNVTARLAAPIRERLPYRIGVGMVLFNEHGEIWLGARRPRWIGPDEPPIWQMPQGGLGGHELPLEAALRELTEETGATSLVAAAELEDWMSFDLPDHLLGVGLKGLYRGQRQLWFAIQFAGDDREFDLKRHEGDAPEFEAWMWATPEEAVRRIVPWKREVYAEVLDAFAEIIAPGRMRNT